MFTLQTTKTTQQEKIRLGNICISFDSWTNTAIPVITAGSSLEIGGSIYYFGADLTIDGDGALAAGGNSTIYYIYADPTDLDVNCSSTTPTYDDAKQGYYATLGGHACRCVGHLYKNSGGTYEQKSIWLSRDHAITNTGFNLGLGANGDRVIRFATDASILWDESENKFYTDKNFSAYGLRISNSLHGTDYTQDQIFDALDPYIPNTNDSILITGSLSCLNGIVNAYTLYIYSFSKAVRSGATTIDLYYTRTHLGYDNGTKLITGSGVYLGSLTMTNGSATIVHDTLSIAW